MLNSSGGAFCPVCAEALVRRLFRHADPVENVTIGGDTTLTAELPAGDVALSWTVDGVSAGTDATLSQRLEVGQEVQLDAAWSDDAVRDDHGDLAEQWRWKVE